MNTTHLLIDSLDFESSRPEWGHITQTSKAKLVEIMGSEKEARELYEEIKESELKPGFYTTTRDVRDGEGTTIERYKTPSLDSALSRKNLSPEDCETIREVVTEERNIFDNAEELDKERFDHIMRLFNAEPLDDEQEETLIKSTPHPKSPGGELDYLKKYFQIEQLEKPVVSQFASMVMGSYLGKRVKHFESLSGFKANPEVKLVIVDETISYYGSTAFRELLESSKITPILAGDYKKYTFVELAEEYLQTPANLQAGDTVIFANQHTSPDIKNLAEELHNKFDITIKTVSGLTGPALVELAQELAEPTDDNTAYQYSANMETYSPSTDMVGATEDNHELVDFEIDTAKDNNESVDAKSTDTPLETNTTEMFTDLSTETNDGVAAAA
jgi:hypothetical protein